MHVSPSVCGAQRSTEPDEPHPIIFSLEHSALEPCNAFHPYIASPATSHLTSSFTGKQSHQPPAPHKSPITLTAKRSKPTRLRADRPWCTGSPKVSCAVERLSTSSLHAMRLASPPAQLHAALRKPCDAAVDTEPPFPAHRRTGMR